MSESFVPFAHQRSFADFWAANQAVLNFSGCGTGKTLSIVHAVKTYWPGARVLVFAPLSILKPAWEKDIRFGWPQTTIAVGAGSAAKKKKAFDSGAQWVVTNHDTVKMVMKNHLYRDFDIVVVDEGDAFRNRSSQRSKALNVVMGSVAIKTLMTGTPRPNGVTDLWHLAFLIDRGERLGRNFFGFRSQVCDPKPIPRVQNAMKWEDKPHANDLVTNMLSDITHRVELDDVVELPPTIVREVTVDLPANLRREYEVMRRESLLMLESGQAISAIHAGARYQKLLQLVSGGMYDENGNAHDLHPARHQLVLDLVEEAEHSIVAFNWSHQRDGLVAEAQKRKITFAVIDGSVSGPKRADIVERFQRGEFRTLFAHPQSAGHGLTLTKANRAIWASPTPRADLYEQFNHRIVRNGQTRRTEIIHIASEATAEQDVYMKLMGKKVRMDDLLATLTQLARAA